MNEKLQRAKRVVSLCKQLHNLTKWKLSSYVIQEAACKRQQQELLNFLEKDVAFTGRFAVIAMHRLQNIAETVAHIAEEKEAQKAKVLHSGRMAHLSEKILQKLEMRNHFEVERKDLSGIIDVSLISRE